ncbi:hypothetical protein OTSGILL_2067 [Orientia tsutsugamushi str. Gilliam]|uniref:Uncharacterized protein n=1 Tax=Orientia tsutsugamushi str. Gilliam TaxID=1359184 RepID=A0A0F3M7H9_ORITS|nr:hypothetical protein OTSGILL_2067 [Orientia tsutsugamushi str. Gilliam]
MKSLPNAHAIACPNTEPTIIPPIKPGPDVAAITSISVKLILLDLKSLS